jgi:hypothetical protein
MRTIWSLDILKTQYKNFIILPSKNYSTYINGFSFPIDYFVIKKLLGDARTFRAAYSVLPPRQVLPFRAAFEVPQPSLSISVVHRWLGSIELIFSPFFFLTLSFAKIQMCHLIFFNLVLILLIVIYYFTIFSLIYPLII